MMRTAPCANKAKDNPNTRRSNPLAISASNSSTSSWGGRLWSRLRRPLAKSLTMRRSMIKPSKRRFADCMISQMYSNQLGSLRRPICPLTESLPSDGSAWTVSTQHYKRSRTWSRVVTEAKLYSLSLAFRRVVKVLQISSFRSLLKFRRNLREVPHNSLIMRTKNLNLRQH